MILPASPLVLASTSPRRQQLLALLKLPFLSQAPLFEEVSHPHLSPKEEALYFASQKALSLAPHFPDNLILGSDTLIEWEGKKLGKPSDLNDARRMLLQLRGKIHQVHTAAAFIFPQNSKSVCHLESVKIQMHNFSDAELDAYLKTKESLDKAGAYGIQGEGGKLIEKIEGDYWSVVGLPLGWVAGQLKRMGYELSSSLPQILSSTILNQRISR